MKRKIRSEHKKLKTILFAIGSLLLILVVGLYQYNHYTVEKNRKLLLGLGEDMKALQVEFNKIHYGWTYDEYCEGVGSTVVRNDRIRCNIFLKNPKDVLSQDNHDKYVKTIEDSRVFETIGIREVGGTTGEFTISSFTALDVPKSSCKLTDLGFAEEGQQGSLFYCSIGDAKAFHFRQE